MEASQSGEHDVWEAGQRVVEELDSDDTDTQGVGLAAKYGNRRFVSDPLQFTGVDLSRSDGRSRRSYAFQNDEDRDESTEEESASGQDTEDENGDMNREEEDTLVQSAFARIRKAKEKGKEDVKLNRRELAALDRRRKRLQAEAEAAARRTSSGSDRRRKKDNRVSVPLSHFDPPSPGRRSGRSASDESIPRSSSHNNMSGSQSRPGPPMGLFPPPKAGRNRPRSATSASQRPVSDHRGSSPFDYQQPSHRQASESSSRPTSSRSRHSSDRDDSRPSSSRSSRDLRDPFQYQTAGPRAPYISGAAAARRQGAGTPDIAYGNAPRRAVPAVARNSSMVDSSEETNSDDGDETTSDEQGNGAHVARARSPDDVVVVEEASPSPEPDRSRSKRYSSRNSPIKRKPVGSGNGGGAGGNSGGRRRKK